MRRVPLLLALAVVLSSFAALAARPRPATGDDVPRIRTVNPGSVFRGGTVDVVIEGQNLHPYDELKCSRNDVAVSLQPGATASKLVVRLVIPSTTPAGPLALTIRTKTGVVKTEKFTVKARAPVVAKVTPTAVVRGGDYDLRLEGTFLAFLGEETKLTVDAPMVAKVSGKPSDKTMTVRVTVPADTPVGPRPITLETIDGKVTTSVTVLLAVPTLASIAPAAVVRATTADVTLTGKNLSGAKDVRLALDDPSVVVTSAGAPTATTVPLRIEVKPGAVEGPRLLVVRTPDGWVTQAFEVVTPVPTFASLKPAGVARGTDVAVTPVVIDVPGAFALRVLPADPALEVVLQPSGAWKIVATADAAPGPRTVVLDHPFGAAVTSFTVSLRSPTVTGATPAALAPGAAADVVIEGQWLDGATIELAAPDAAVTLTPTSPGVVHIAVAADARPGVRPLVVRTADGATVVNFTVSGTGGSAPIVNSALPGRIPRGRATEVVLAGVNLRSAGDQPPTVTATLDGAPVPATVVASTAAAVKVRLEPPAGARAGACVVVVRTSDGVAAGVTSLAPAVPTIANLAVTSSARPGPLAVVVTGADLLGPSGAMPTVVLVRPDGSDPVPAAVTTAAPGRLLVEVPLTAATVPGPRVLLVTTSEGGVAAPLVVPATPPRITALDPVTLGIPARVEFTVTGTELVGPGGAAPVVTVTRLGAPAPVKADLLDASPTTLRVRIVTLAGTQPGTHVLAVRTADGVAAGLFEIVNAPMPVLTSLQPAAGPRLSTVTVVLEGTGLLGASAVTFAGDGVTAAIQPGATDTKVYLRVTVANNAVPGARAITVTAPGGLATTPKLVFTVE